MPLLCRYMFIWSYYVYTFWIVLEYFFISLSLYVYKVQELTSIKSFTCWWKSMFTESKECASTEHGWEILTTICCSRLQFMWWQMQATEVLGRKSWQPASAIKWIRMVWQYTLVDTCHWNLQKKKDDSKEGVFLYPDSHAHVDASEIRRWHQSSWAL